MSEKNNQLELYIVEKLKPLDPNARPTKASGASTELGDVYNTLFFVECKQKHTSNNINVHYKKEYLKLLNETPINTKKPVFVATENNEGKVFITMEAEDFFRLVYKAEEK